MDETTFSQRTLKTAGDYEAAIDVCLSEIQLLRGRMEEDQVEIDRLKVETRAILAELVAA